MLHLEACILGQETGCINVKQLENDMTEVDHALGSTGETISMSSASSSYTFGL